MSLFFTPNPSFVASPMFLLLVRPDATWNPLALHTFASCAIHVVPVHHGIDLQCARREIKKELLQRGRVTGDGPRGARAIGSIFPNDIVSSEDANIALYLRIRGSVRVPLEPPRANNGIFTRGNRVFVVFRNRRNARAIRAPENFHGISRVAAPTPRRTPERNLRERFKI